MNTVASLRTQGITAREACDALGVSAATFYRRGQPRPVRVTRPRPSPPRTLPAAEREHVLEVLHSERFVDSSPAQVSATLLDDDQKYLCSPRTMYRILDEAQESRSAAINAGARTTRSPNSWRRAPIRSGSGT